MTRAVRNADDTSLTIWDDSGQLVLSLRFDTTDARDKARAALSIVLSSAIEMVRN